MYHIVPDHAANQGKLSESLPPNNKRRSLPPPVIINNPGGQKLFIRGAYLLKGFGRTAFKFLLKSIEIEEKSR